MCAVGNSSGASQAYSSCCLPGDSKSRSLLLLAIYTAPTYFGVSESIALSSAPGGDNDVPVAPGQTAQLMAAAIGSGALA